MTRMMTPMNNPLILLILALFTVAKPPDAPPNPPADTPPPEIPTGSITGTITPAKGFQGIVAVESFDYKNYPGTIDAATGKFTIPELPPGDYDLLIKTFGHLYEGIRLETDPDAQPLTGKPLTGIRDQIEKYFFPTEDYFNVKKIVRLTGTADRARMFVVQTRNKPVLDGNGDPVLANVRRFDLVEMVRTDKVWQIAFAKFLYREYVPYGTGDARIELKYSPGLSGFLIGTQARDIGTITLTKLPPGPVGKYVSGDYTAK